MIRPIAKDNTVHTAHFGHPNTPRISICIPTWHDDAKPLLDSLRQLKQADMCEVLIYDDGSNDPHLTDRLIASCNDLPCPARLMTAAQNQGRAYGRNMLIAQARADWLLLLDADMLPDNDDFIACYMREISNLDKPTLIVGGFSLQQVRPTVKQRLHAAQSAHSECLPAIIRQRMPGRYVFTSNILVHRHLLNTVQFNDAYQGWGWEDTDWGLNIARKFPIHHIDNTATHLGLDAAEDLIHKYGTSGENFARLAKTHPEDIHQTSLYRAARRLKDLPGRRALQSLAARIARGQFSFIPMPVRLFALKLYRAAAYAGAIE